MIQAHLLQAANYIVFSKQDVTAETGKYHAQGSGMRVHGRQVEIITVQHEI